MPQTANQSITSIVESTLEPNQSEKENSTVKKTGYVIKRQDRGLKNIADQVKNIIASKKASTNIGCKKIIYQMMLAEINYHRDKDENLKTIKADERMEHNIKLRVNETQCVLINANIFQQIGQQITLKEGLFPLEVKKYKMFEIKTQQNVLKYKRAELCGMIKKYAILKNIMARNKMNPKEKKISMPFLMVHRSNHTTSKMLLDQPGGEKTALILCTGDIMMQGHMKVLLGSKMINTMPDFGFGTFVKNATTKLSDHIGFTPSFLKEGSLILKDLMSMGKTTS